MARTYSVTKDKKQKQSKFNYKVYFNKPNEPWRHMYADMPAELVVELLENNGTMKRKFRRLAHRMRIRNA